MTTRFKDFGSGENVNKEPLSFQLYGESFECYSSIQGKVLLDMVSDASSNDAEAAAKTITNFFSHALKPESYKRFEDLIENPDKIVNVETLGEITGWLTEQYSGRPQQGPEQSQSGQ
jgi:hypothetical protein